MATSKLLKGALSISRPHGPQPPYIELALVDDLSGAECVSIQVELTNFAEALTGLARVECEFAFRPRLVGKQREHKTEIVPFAGRYRNAEDATKALAPFETEGWKGRADDLFNSHNRIPEGHRVIFERYVDVKEQS